MQKRVARAQLLAGFVLPRPLQTTQFRASPARSNYQLAGRSGTAIEPYPKPGAIRTIVLPPDKETTAPTRADWRYSFG